MTKIRCRAGCGTFYDKKESTCPCCGTIRWPINVALINSAWESNLHKQTAHNVKYG